MIRILNFQLIMSCLLEPKVAHHAPSLGSIEHKVVSFRACSVCAFSMIFSGFIVVLLNDLFAIITGSTAKFNDHNRKRYSN